jgi:hypothetical protein
MPGALEHIASGDVSLMPCLHSKTVATGYGGYLYHLLPFIEQNTLYNATICYFNGAPSTGYDIEAGGYPSYSWINQPIKSFVCRADPTGGRRQLAVTLFSRMRV